MIDVEPSSNFKLDDSIDECLQPSAETNLGNEVEEFLNLPSVLIQARHRRARRLTVGSLCAAATVMAVGEVPDLALTPTTASAKPIVVHAKPSEGKVSLPKEPGGKITLRLAKTELRGRHLHYDGAVADGKLLKNPDPEQEEAQSWLKKDVHQSKLHGKVTEVVKYSVLSANSKLLPNSNVFVSVKKKSTPKPILPPSTQPVITPTPLPIISPTPSPLPPETTPTPTPEPTPPATESLSTPCSEGCSVVGNSIEDASNNPVILHGVVRDSLEDTCTGFNVFGVQTGIPETDFATMENVWNANAVRLPLNQDFWLPGAAKYCSNYQNVVQTAVDNAEANNMVVILDLHWSDDGSLADTKPEQQCMPDANSLSFWTDVANRYKNDPNVMFEIYNEPYPPGATVADQWNTWKFGGSVTCVATYSGAPEETFNSAGMQSIVDAIRATGAKNIILAGALTANPKSSLNGVPLLSGGNIGYTVHPYDNGQSAANQISLWNTEFGNEAEEVPEVATEFGDFTCGDSTYDDAILSYFKTHNIGFTAFSWIAVDPCSYPGLITDAAGDCTNTMGCTIQKAMEAYGPAIKQSSNSTLTSR
jgi:endoglucanase